MLNAQYRSFSVLSFYFFFLVLSLSFFFLLVLSFLDYFLLFLGRYTFFRCYFPFVMITLITCVLLSALPRCAASVHPNHHPASVINSLLFLPCCPIVHCEPLVHFSIYTYSVYFSVFFFSIAGTTVGFWIITCALLTLLALLN